MANMYCDEGNLESAFILYSKFITLFVERLPSHPDYKTSPPNDIQDFKRKVKKVFPLAEEIKSQLKKRYTEEEDKRQIEEKKRQEQLAIEEEKRRKEAEEQMREDEALARKLQSEAEQQWMQEQEDKYKRLQHQEEERLAAEHKRREEEASSSKDGSVLLIPADISGVIPAADGASPSVPTPAASSAPMPHIPDRELKKNLNISDQSSSVNDIPSVPPPPYSPPIPDRSTKPADHFMSTGLFGGSGGLRDVIVPADLMQKFIVAAQSNTLRKTETMGILCGKVSGHAFRITHLFVPHQTGTPDSCDMQNEEELIFYQDKHDLITLGWIHTHPTQTAFLSSVDMHTHFAYQKMLPEAVAIVCSPKFQETGLFSLTDLGLDVIGTCREKSFHYHAKEPPLFESSAHAKVVTDASVTLTDMRK